MTRTGQLDDGTRSDSGPANTGTNARLSTVTAIELAKKVIELLGLKQGELFEIAKTRGGEVLVRRAEA